MTESEAKTKWCPMTRAPIEIDDRLVAGNTMKVPGSAETTITTCIGSACMLWREHGPLSPDYKPRPDEVGGYCGLAGRP